MTRIKKCLHCTQPFIGRRDAKTCSTRCRKAMQRKRQSLAVAHDDFQDISHVNNSNNQLPNFSQDLKGLAGHSL